jgi:hypothetical protein
MTNKRGRKLQRPPANHQTVEGRAAATDEARHTSTEAREIGQEGGDAEKQVKSGS